jgi:DNA polymerase III epsilon subunit-like protein
MNEKIIILDTETTNSIDDPFCYDIGFAVVDTTTGEAVETYSFVNADVFLNSELMESAYFKDKIPAYWEDIKCGKRQLKKFRNIRKTLHEVCKAHNISVICAHNASFDYRSCNYTQRYISSSKYRYFFPYGVKIWDTLKMSKEIFGNDNAYQTFCWKNDFVTDKGVARYTAEIIYRYLTGIVDFDESHTGLEDVMIEKEIFMHCVRKNPSINGKLWA